MGGRQDKGEGKERGRLGEEKRKGGEGKREKGGREKGRRRSLLSHHYSALRRSVGCPSLVSIAPGSSWDGMKKL